MKTGRMFGLFIVTLFLIGIVVSAFAAKAPIESTLDSYGSGSITKDIDTSGYTGLEEFAWEPRYNPHGVAMVTENEIRIDAKGLPGNCEFMAYLVDPVNMKVYGLGDKGYTFRSDEHGNGNFRFTVPLTGYDPIPMNDLSDWGWKSIDIQMKPGCVGASDSNQKVLALDLERLTK